MHATESSRRPDVPNMKTPPVFLALAALFLSASSVLAGKDIRVTEVPDPAIAAIAAHFGDLKLKSAEIDTDDERVIYKVKIIARGKEFEVEVTPDGRIIDIDD